MALLGFVVGFRGLGFRVSDGLVFRSIGFGNLNCTFRRCIGCPIIKRNYSMV